MTDFNTAGGTSSLISDLILTHYSGANGDCDPTNNQDPTVASVMDLTTTSSAYDMTDFYLECSVSHFSEFAAGGGGLLLPVEMTYFEAEKDGKTSLLTWETASEENNKGFHIQRSTDGNEFETIGWIDGFGTSTEINEYRFVDIQPVSGINYYRLLQEDFDGTTSLSEVRTVSFKRDLTMLVYPNPTKQGDEITIQLNSEYDGQEIDINVFNTLGEQILSYAAMVNEGNNAIPLSTKELSNGVYIITVNHNGNTESIKLQVLK